MSALGPVRAFVGVASGSAESALVARTHRGTHAVLATRLLSIACTAASITILARLIPPGDFGLWAMAGVPLGMMTIMREFGLGSAIVREHTLTAEQQDAYFWTSVGVSVATAILLALAAPLLASFYGDSLLRPVIWACCAALPIMVIGLVHVALLRRSLRYDKLVVVEGGGMVCGVLAGLAGAYLWRDVWALVAGYIASASWMSASALVLCRWRPGLPRVRGARIKLSFSVQVALSNLLTFAGNNVGLVVGYRLPAAELGYYNRGQQLYNLAQFALLTPITEVGFALLCRLGTDEASRRAFIALARRVAILFIPYAVVLPIVSADLVRAVLGPAWTPAGPVLACFAPAVLAQALAALLAQLLVSQGRGQVLRNWAAVDVVLRTAGALLGSRFGVVGIAAGFSLAALLSVPLLAWRVSQSGPVRLRDQIEALLPGTVVAAAALLAATAVALAEAALGLEPGWERLLFIGGSAVLGWSLVCAAWPQARDALLGRGVAHA